MKKNDKASRIIIFVVAAILFALFIYFLFPFAKMLCTEEGREEIDDKVKSYGIFAPVVFIGIEILQIIAAFIPGSPVEIMSGVLFGGFWGIILCFIGIFAGTALVFGLVRKFGRPFVYKIIPEEKFNSIRILNDEKKLTLTVFLLFVIPGTPKDFLTYIAGLTKIRPAKFFMVATLARTPSMACSVFMGANLGEGRFLASLIVFLVILALTGLGYLIKKKFIDGKYIKYKEDKEDRK